MTDSTDEIHQFRDNALQAMNDPGFVALDPSLLYVQNIKIRLLGRLYHEQVEALSRADKLSDQERNNYQTRKSRIVKLARELGLESDSAAQPD